MGLPRQKEFYVHRIGRTGRAGQKGMAISFITPSDMRELKYVERLTKQKLTEYKLPKSNELKEVMVNSELTKMDGLKEAMIKLQDEFKVDQSFVLYENFFKGLTKDQILKLMFSYNFKKSMRELEETLSMSQRTPKSGAGREKTRRDRRGRPSRGGERRDGRLKPRKSQRRSRR
jgi:ATP-dependent RNA helicase DeaD